MKQIFKIIILILFTFFSFFYTEKIINLSRENDFIMKKIRSELISKEIKPVNGIVENNTILIGASGKTIDIETSYEKMKKANSYNESLLEYKGVEPLITKEDNYDRLIIGSNTKEKNISLVFQTDDIFIIKQIIYISNINSIPITLFIDYETIMNNLLYFKSSLNKNITLGLYSYKDRFDSISIKYVKRLSKNFNASNYCLYKNSLFLNACKLYKINTIKPIIINKNVYNYFKKNKQSGRIYLIENTRENIKELNSSIIYMKQKGYKIVNINDLLKE